MDGYKLSDYNSGIKVRPSKWQQHNQLVTGRTQDAQELNEQIAQVALQHREILRELKRRYQKGEGPRPTPELIKAEFLQPGSTSPRLHSWYKTYLDYLDSLNGLEDGRAEKTLARAYKTWDYIKKFDPSSPYLVDITTGWGKRFHAWLQTDPETGKRRMQKDTANKHLAHVRDAISHAIDEGFLSNNVLDKFRPKRGKGKEVYFLEPTHINRLMGLQLTDTSMAGVLWWAKLMCLTGLDYVDAIRYATNRNAFEQPTTAGKTKIVIERTKPPRNYCEIYLLPELEALLAEHPTGPYAPTLADVNRNLKVIADAIEFPLTFTSKICRKTAGAYFLRLGFQIATVSKMLGHSSIRTTEAHYVRVTSSQVDHDIERVARMGETTPIRPVISHNPFVQINKAS
ncbi:site-specific integrase [Spirosoma sp. RP8]|uniref:Site-specific integrase n=1 Tax=Spirosoma liriopis TaxID=2937440 RepID=A0ABT0HV88_9BACT|nr:phage integrase SAM-like domain-containing protein [Spirosoma liriopis]MCK8496063.1 site-specific integrase [Spirosoma liriopis]